MLLLLPSLHLPFIANDHWNQDWAQNCVPSKGADFTATDFWNTTGPAVYQRNDPSCSQAKQAGCVYEDDILLASFLRTLEAHDPATPLFFLFSSHAVHEPYEVPQVYLDRFSHIKIEVRQYYMAMVAHIDDVVGNVTAALKAKGMWDQTLFISSSDNGGPLANGVIDGLVGTSGGNNYPLRGGKIGVLEGGVRVNAFISGGFVPAAVRGTKNEGLMEIADWYATVCGLAGVSATDHVAAAASLPPVDSLDMWPMLSGANLTSPRTQIAIGTSDDSDHKGNTQVQALIQNDGDKIHKLILGQMSPAFFQSPTFPNASAATRQPPLKCGDPNAVVGPKGPGCLFDILADPHETTDLAASFPGKVTEMRKTMEEIQKVRGRGVVWVSCMRSRWVPRVGAACTLCGGPFTIAPRLPADRLQPHAHWIHHQQGRHVRSGEEERRLPGTVSGGAGGVRRKRSKRRGHALLLVLDATLLHPSHPLQLAAVRVHPFPFMDTPACGGGRAITHPPLPA